MKRIYVVSTEEWARENKYKLGKHTGSKKLLEHRYITSLIDPIVYAFVQVDNYTEFEKDLFVYLDKYNLLRKTGSRTEWFRVDLANILRKINKLKQIYADPSGPLAIKFQERKRAYYDKKLTSNPGEKTASETRGDQISIMMAIDESDYDMNDLMRRQSQSQLRKTEKLALKKYYFRMNFDIEQDDPDMETLMNKWLGKEVYLQRFELLFGYRRVSHAIPDPTEAAKERLRLKVILDFVNRLLRRKGDNKITKLRPRHLKSIKLSNAQYSMALSEIFSKSIYFKDEDKYRRLFNRRPRRNANVGNIRVQQTLVLQSLLKLYNIVLKAGPQRRVVDSKSQRKDNRIYTYTLDYDAFLGDVIMNKHKQQQIPNRAVIEV